MKTSTPAPASPTMTPSTLPSSAPPTRTPPRPPTATLTPTRTPIPTATPTATPVPPLVLKVHWPPHISALRPALIQAELVPPPRISLTATLNAIVLDPEGFIYQSFDLSPQRANLYSAGQPLQLPLEAAGDWRLVVKVQLPRVPGLSGEMRVEGQRTFGFRPAPIPFHVLTDTLHTGVDLRVPLAFQQEASQGNPWAGMRAWRYGDGELSLWWAPGPTEPLLRHNAVVMLEATHDPADPPQVLSVQSTDWKGHTAFLFREDWGEGKRESAQIPAEALVVQGDDFWLYVLRVRALQGTSIPPLLRLAWESLSFIE